ncbi:MAG: cation:proton antiporter [Candidatus Altiarchaeota archaeon]
MESVLVGFTVCLLLAFLLSEFFYRLRYPRVIGQILAGLILGIPLIRDYVFGGGGIDFIGSLADIGVVFLMLLVGTEIRIHDLKKASKKAFVLACLGYIIPLVMGFIFMRALGYDTLTAVIVAICLAISAEAVTIDILMEYKMLNTALGTTMMEAGMIDDIFGVLSLAAVITVVQGGGVSSLMDMPGDFMTFILISYLLGVMVLPKAAKAVWKEKSEPAVLSLAVIFGLIVVVLSMVFGLSSVVGAFVAGVIIQISIKNRMEEKEIVESLNIVTFGLVIPFFFIYTGMNLDVMKVMDAVFLTFGITVIAIAGKLFGAHIVGLIYRMKPMESRLLGWGMNPRGAVELIIVNIAKSRGLISNEIYSAVVTMAIISALISPVMFRRTCEAGGCHGRAEHGRKKNHHFSQADEFKKPG